MLSLLYKSLAVWGTMAHSGTEASYESSRPWKWTALGLLIIVIVHISGMAHRDLCIHCFVWSLKRSHERGGTNTVGHSLLHEVASLWGFHDILSFPMLLLPQFLSLLC